MMVKVLYVLRTSLIALFVCGSSVAQEQHDHGVPEKLGAVSFPISCQPAEQVQFNRGVSLLHSFAYSAAERTFRAVAQGDPTCAMAHWGIAMTYFHQLWQPPILPTTVLVAKAEIERARAIGSSSERERRLIEALALMYVDGADLPYSARVSRYEMAVCELAGEDQGSVETQTFCALALLANVSPFDKAHTKQKRAAEILEPLWRTYPEHPGIAHYLIHAYDNEELAHQGLPAARAYSRIAQSAPHALHMPSHIFTRLGLWQDSINSNRAAREAAHQQGDLGEELHAMDYLEYAYLQSGRDSEAAQLVDEVRNMPSRNSADFKIGYAATAIPIRYVVERGQWEDAAKIPDPTGVAPHVAAIAAWARGLGSARTGQLQRAQKAIDHLKELENLLRTEGNQYWAGQTAILAREVAAWSAEEVQKREESVKLMREAADDEDAIEKLPVTPGPIVPAREQLAYLLLRQNQPCLAQKEFAKSLDLAPGRRASVQGSARAAELCKPR
jgi:tetratricopeptide (TPR) repeat protein